MPTPSRTAFRNTTGTSRLWRVDLRGRSHRNHNTLLGRVEGVDGIKTGFTNASGFNLVTNVRTDDRHIVGVVLGGRSGPSRDRIMASLIQTNLPRAYAGVRIAPATAEQPAARPVVVADHYLGTVAAIRSVTTAEQITVGTTRT